MNSCRSEVMVASFLGCRPNRSQAKVVKHVPAGHIRGMVDARNRAACRVVLTTRRVSFLLAARGKERRRGRFGVDCSLQATIARI